MVNHYISTQTYPMMLKVDMSVKHDMWDILCALLLYLGIQNIFVGGGLIWNLFVWGGLNFTLVKHSCSTQTYSMMLKVGMSVKHDMWDMLCALILHLYIQNILGGINVIMVNNYISIQMLHSKQMILLFLFVIGEVI